MQAGDGLTRGGHDAADLVQLVTEEVKANGEAQVSRIHINGTAARAKGSRAVKLASIGEPTRFQGMDKVIEILDARRLGTGHVG